MIHELLLALSGHPSPLLKDKNEKIPKSSIDNLLSPAENALLTSLSRDLGQRHSSIRTTANDVVTSHPSTVCRAVCASILSKHLAQFQQKILDVERDILDENSSIVGAYNIVPLSSILGAFNGWERKLDWLWRLVSSIHRENLNQGPRARKEEGLCTASGMIGYLRDATHTGYPEIEELSVDLVAVAETAWLKQLTFWMLYGKLPSIGTADFFISRVAQSDDDDATDIYSMRHDLVPPFVEPDTANSILFVGRSLNYLRARGACEGMHAELANGPSTSILQSHHLAELSSLRFPINPSRFSTAIRSIRLSLSKTALRRLLPLTKVLEVLQVLKGFFLLERGEFALALISAADERLAEKQSSSRDNYKMKGPDTLKHIMIKEGEVNSILPRVWSTLASLQTLDDEDGDEGLELARELVGLSLESKTQHQKGSTGGLALPDMADDFQDLLLPTATVLTLQNYSPLDLFLTPSDVTTYSRIHAYLLAIRRAHLHLSKTMTLAALRRGTHPPLSNSPSERSQVFNHQRYRTLERFKIMRPIWATVGSATYLLAELLAYFQSEVIEDCWREFHRWLNPQASTSLRPQFPDEFQRSASLTASVNSRPDLPDEGTLPSGAADQTEKALRDPERLMMAHQTFLNSLCQALLLKNTSFINRLRTFMTDVDHLCALLARLSVGQQSRDVEKDIGSRSTATNGEFEEAHFFGDLASVRGKLDTGLTSMVSLLRDAHSTHTSTTEASGIQIMKEDDEFVPKENNRLDRLLLKLDYTSPQTMATSSRDVDTIRWSD
ncbi:MAG: hypothetical protein LQ343_008028 [Gyalolechia ehrenbergii]|nr:MAG: hypothetical protein LQ343_008028 [Gyalolechia ehrenbergii]